MPTDHKLKIAVVDDDPVLVELICAMLQDEAFEPIACPNQMTAYSCIREERPHAILLDVNMAGLNGVAIYHMLRHDLLTQDIPVVFLTGDVDRLRTLLPSFKERGTMVLAKPFDTEELVTVLRQTVEAPLQ